jgi:hypothetical protein
VILQNRGPLDTAADFIVDTARIAELEQGLSLDAEQLVKQALVSG